MWIRRIAVQHWRGLNAELNELSPHLNLIFGPNEAGKSRLVEAARFALFESSKGRSEHKKALATWGRTGDKPTVTLEFERNGARWRLEKTFLGAGYNTTLKSDAQRLQGVEAEDRLAELIGVTPGGRKALKPEDLGIWSLLWVDQGASREAPAHNEASQTRIQAQLTQEIGEVAAGERGQDMLRRAEAQRNRYYTASRDEARAPLTEARQRVQQLGERLQEARARRDGIAADADALDQQRASERALLVRVADAQTRLESVRVLEQRAADLGQRLELSDTQVQNAEGERDRRAERVARAQTLDREIDTLVSRIAAATADHGEADAKRLAAQQAADEAVRLTGESDQRHADAERRVTALRRQQERRRLEQQAEQIRGRLADAQRVTERIDAVRRELAALPRVSAKDVEQLRQAQEARDTAQARLEGASASVELLARQDLRISGEPLASGEQRRVLVEDEHRLDVEGVVTITVRPGGGELPRLRDARSDAQRALTKLLTTLAVADVAQAEQIAQQRRDHAADMQRGRDELARHLPEGREAAQDTLQALQAQLERDPVTDSEPYDPDTLQQAEAALAEAASRRDASRTRREVAFEQLADARERAATADAALQSLRRQLDDARKRRAELPEIATLQAELAQAERSWRERVAAREEMEREFDALGGEDIQLDLEQATRAHEQLTHEQQQVRLACARLVARLEAVGNDGRHERVQELEAELARAEEALARVERDAAAARRLHEVLLDEYQQARERLAEPVIARIRPHLQSLFPNTEVWLDEDLNLKGLRSEDTDQDFDALSGGAREQLALLVRVGLAEVLGAEEPHPLVLDDVLVNTDADRIRLVQRVLYQASRRMQILLFTCHGPLFDGLGADARVELPATRRP